MSDTAALLTVAEAAAVAGVTRADVNRMIEEGVLPARLVDRTKRRRVASSACGLISFYIETADGLSEAERRAVVEQAAWLLATWRPRGVGGPEDHGVREAAFVVERDDLRFDLEPFLTRADERLAMLEEAREMVVRDPEILRGRPSIRGTRVEPCDVAALVADDGSVAEVLEVFPYISIRDIELATLYVAAYPYKRRTREVRLPPEKLISSHTYRLTEGGEWVEVLDRRMLDPRPRLDRTRGGPC